MSHFPGLWEGDDDILDVTTMTGRPPTTRIVYIVKPRFSFLKRLGFIEKTYPNKLWVRLFVRFCTEERVKRI